MIAGPAGGLRFTLDLPSTHEPRRYKVRPVAETEAGAVEELLRHAPGVTRSKPPADTSLTAAALLGVFDEMRVLRAFVDLRLGQPAPDAAYIELIVVDPRYRRAGLGEHLVTAIAARLKDAGARRLCLEVDDDNEAAARFWQRQGFVEQARTTRRTFEKCL